MAEWLEHIHPAGNRARGELVWKSEPERRFCACAPDGAFRDVNRAFLDMFGLESVEDAQKATFAELMNDEPLPELFSQALAGEPSRTRIRAENDDGAEEIEISLAPDRQGKKLRGVVGSVFRV